LYFFRTCFFAWIVLSCSFVFTVDHKHSCRIFLFSSSLFVLYPYLFLRLDCPQFWLLFLLYNTHNTNINAPGGIRTRNPRKRSAADPRLRTHGHLDWQNRTSLPQLYRPWHSRYSEYALFDVWVYVHECVSDTDSLLYFLLIIS
jgi:hypothetical protein